MEETIHDRIKKVISHFGLNASSFAKRVGVSVTVIQNLVGGRFSKPSFDVLEKIIDATGVNSDWLIIGKGEPFTESQSWLTGESPVYGIQNELLACKKEVNLLNQRIADKDEVIGLLKAQIANSGNHRNSSQTA